MVGPEPLGRDYLLHEEIGRGAWAVVRRATSRSGGPVLAAKLLRPQFAANRRVRDLLLREEAALRDLDQPSIVALRDLVVEGGGIALLMEYVDGPDLRRFLAQRGGALPVGEVRTIGAQVAAALAAAHAHGVVHLDLKPENVLVAGADPATVKISDFGVAALLSDADPGAPGGTPGYIAPEVLDGRAATGAADVYALGVLLTEIATGGRPGTAGPVPAELAGLIQDCLATDPRARPSARSLAATLRSAAYTAASAEAGTETGTGWLNPTRLRPSGERVPAVTSPPPGRPWSRRRLAYGVSGAVLVVAGVSGFALNAVADEHHSAAPTAQSSSSATVSTAGAPAPATLATTKLAAPAGHSRGTYAAHLPNNAGSLYLALRDGKAIAYLCDGKKLEAWFTGTVSPGMFSLTGKTAGSSLNGSFTAANAAGQVTVGGKTTYFTIPQVHKPSGLYRAAGKVRNAQVKGGWIVLPDGRQVGVLTVGDVEQPAPALDTTSLSAAVPDGTVTASEIDADSGAGF
jgi:serine/threonine-protein kinase